jgi:ATP-dependent helicase/nuclease subunit B
MPIELQILDWSKPALPQAARWLAERFGEAANLDLGEVIVCVPGAPVRRRLLELLVEVAAEWRLLLAPPEIVTPGHLPELLYEAKRPFASELTQQLAWVKVLQGIAKDGLSPLVRTLPETDDLPAWLALGQMLSELHRELSADGLGCEAVLAEAANCDGFNETARWKLLAELERRYLRLLDSLQVWDKQTARLFAIEHRECSTEKQIVLVGLVDLNRAQRQMLELVNDRVTALVFAPKDSTERFDEHGCLRPDQWQEYCLSLADEQIEIADGPGDQADAVVRQLDRLDGRYAAEEIVVGVPDPQLVPFVRQRLEESNVPARFAGGMPLARTGPCQLLAEVADYLENRRFSDLAALVRHPAIARWLAAAQIEQDWLTRFDRFYTGRLPAQAYEKLPNKLQDREDIRAVQAKLTSLIAPLFGRDKPLDAWARPILDLLAEAYGVAPLDENLEPDRTIILACGKIREALKTHLEIDKSLSPSISAAGALRLVLRDLEAESASPQSDGEAIELLGWLDLIWNDAPAVIICGFNEGVISPAIGRDMFLPNALRQRLPVEDNERRLARDKYALGLIAASRERLHIIAGRRSAANDPLVPSRLLFACGDGELARRAKRLFGPPTAASRRILLPGSLRPRPTASNMPVPPPDPLLEPPLTFRVTEFKTYIACPYRYYLRHRLKLEALADTASELDPAQFGNLLHDALMNFGRSEARDSADPAEIRAELFNSLGQLAAIQYGKVSQPAVQVQIELIKLRLAAFAERQAQWRGQGWQIKHVEIEFAEKDGKQKPAPFAVDGRTALLCGRVDRIDEHEQTGQWAVLDYKSSETASKPNETHRTRDEWVDLQLPLYRHLVRGLDPPGGVQLGYIHLPKDVRRTGFSLAEWTEEELRQADETAREVVRRIWDNRFSPPAVPPPAFFEEFAAICQDGRFGAAAAMDGEVEEAGP